MLCVECNAPIPKGRLEAIPDATTCVKCSGVKPMTTADIEVDGAADSEDRIDSANGNGEL